LDLLLLCVEKVRSVLEENGCEVLVFHATGTGGRAMESLIESGFIDAVADITTTEWADELVGGVLSAGPTRLDAAAKKRDTTSCFCRRLGHGQFWSHGHRSREI